MMACLLAGELAPVGARALGAARAAHPAAGDPRGNALPDGDRAREPQAAAAVVFDRGRGSRRRAPDRQALLLPQAARPGARRRPPTATRLPRRGRHRAVGVSAGDQVSVRAHGSARATVADADGDGGLPGAGPAAAGAPARAAVAAGARRASGRRAGTASWRGCARFATATIRATSTGGPARGAGCRSCASTRTTRGARRLIVFDNDSPRGGADRGRLRAGGLADGGALRGAGAPRAGGGAGHAGGRGCAGGRTARSSRACCALLAFIAPEVGPRAAAPARRAVVRVRPGADIDLAGAAPPGSRGRPAGASGRMRFQAAHKLVHLPAGAVGAGGARHHARAGPRQRDRSS